MRIMMMIIATITINYDHGSDDDDDDEKEDNACTKGGKLSVTVLAGCQMQP